MHTIINVTLVSCFCVCNKEYAHEVAYIKSFRHIVKLFLNIRGFVCNPNYNTISGFANGGIAQVNVGERPQE